MEDEDGGVMFEANGAIETPHVEPGEFSTANQVFNLIGVQFARPGNYKFVLQVGDAGFHETPFVVAQTTAEL